MLPEKEAQTLLALAAYQQTTLSGKVDQQIQWKKLSRVFFLLNKKGLSIDPIYKREFYQKSRIIQYSCLLTGQPADFCQQKQPAWQSGSTLPGQVHRSRHRGQEQ